MRPRYFYEEEELVLGYLRHFDISLSQLYIPNPFLKVLLKGVRACDDIKGYSFSKDYQQVNYRFFKKYYF